MADFFKKKAKLLFIAYAILLFVILIFGLFYMTQYAHIRINYSISTAGVVSFSSDSTMPSLDTTNSYLFEYFKHYAGQVFTSSSSGEITMIAPAGLVLATTEDINNIVSLGYAKNIYDFQNSMSSFNTQIIIFVVISFVLLAVMLICSNHSRNVYYISNLVSGIAMPAAITIYSIIMMIMNLSLMNTFTKNETLFKVVAALNNTDGSAQDKGGKYFTDPSYMLSQVESVNTTTYIIATVLFILVAIASIGLIVYTIWRYNECSKHRNEIMERAAHNND